MEAKEMLLKAADHMERVGHCQESYFLGIADPEDPKRLEVPCCLLGSLRAVAPEQLLDHQYLAASHALQVAIQDSTERSICGIVAWNDYPGRTKEEAVAMLRKATVHL